MNGYVFISYALADGQPFARSLYDKLTAQGIAAWMDQRGGIPGASIWADEIERAVRACDLLIFVMTPGSKVSPNCADEWNFALKQKKPILPLFVIATEVPMRLDRIQYLDFTKRTLDEGFADILTVVNRHVVVNTQSRTNSSNATSLEADRTATLSEQLRQLAERLNRMPAHFPSWQVIAPGHVQLGDAGLPDALPHTVTLAPYLIAQTPITQVHYQRFLLLTPQQPIPSHEFYMDYSWDRTLRVPPGDKRDHPVVLVSAGDAEAYAEWLSDEIAHELSTLGVGWRARLPTEDEWEAAARGSDGRRYTWGWGAPERDLCNFDGLYGGTTSVSQFAAHLSHHLYAHDLLDMAGNVWEWTHTAPADQPHHRVLRGGSWQAGAHMNTLRAAFRYVEQRGYVDETIGFRVVIAQSAAVDQMEGGSDG